MKEWMLILLSELVIALSEIIVFLFEFFMYGTGVTLIVLWILLLVVVAGAVLAGYILEEKTKAERRKR